MSRDQFGVDFGTHHHIPRPGTKSLGAVRHGYPDGTSEKSGSFIDEAAVRRKIARLQRALRRVDRLETAGARVDYSAVSGPIVRNARLAQLILRQHKKAA